MNKSLLHAASTALRLAALMGVTAGIVFAQPAPDSNNSTTTKNDEPQKLDRFEVTGSRIKRLDAEGPAPVQAFTAQDIASRGFTNLADFVQSLPFNSGGAASVIQTASFTRGANTINPRALGHGRFLVLVNGRRAVSYALSDSTNRSVFDFNSIPIEAVDSIEYLKDGASAIYGSDAVTGVMNIKLKKTYSGLSTSMLYGSTLGHDTGTLRASVLAGAATAKTSIMFNLSWFKQNSNYIKDYDRSKTTDYSYLGTNKGANQNSTSNYPANLNISAAQATAAGLSGGAGLYVVTGGVPNANPTRSSFTRYATAAAIPNENRYDFAQTYQLVPPREYWNVFSYMEHELLENLSAFGQMVYSNNMTKYGFTPAVIQSTSTFTSAGTSLSIPANNPYNPFGIPLTNFLYRTNFGDVRKFDTESQALSLTGGLKGSFNENWSWESAVSYGSSNVTTVSRNQIKADSLQAAFNGTTRATALNPFGPSDNQELVDKLFTISNASGKGESHSVDATVSGSLFDMPDLFGVGAPGSVGLAVGGEWRQESLEGRPDTQSYVGSGGGSPFFGSRTVESLYAEVDVPVVRRYLEMQLAARWENYSDFGRTIKPKVAFSSQPIDMLKIRGSYSRSFKAPDLGQLYTTRQVSFTSTNYSDPLRPQDPSQQLRIVTGGNPNLQPESGEIMYGGIVVDLDKHVKGLSFNIDYFDFNIEDVIVSYTGPNTIFQYFPERVIRDPSTGTPGTIVYLEATPNNVAQYIWRGFDFGVDYRLRNTRSGNWRFAASASRVLYYGYNAGLNPRPTNYVGTYNVPKWTAEASTSWNYRDFGASLSAVYKGKYFNDAYTATGWGENPIARLNATISYNGFYGIKTTIGVDNLLDKDPPINGRETSSFDQSTYAGWGLGRFVYVRLSREF